MSSIVRGCFNSIKYEKHHQLLKVEIRTYYIVLTFQYDQF